MRLDDFTRHLTKEEEQKISQATSKAVAVYLLTKKRNEEEDQALISCVASYILLFFMIIAIIIGIVLLSRNTIIDEAMIKSFAIKATIFIAVVVILDLFVVGKKWYAYLNKTKENIRNEINNKLRG